MKKARTGITLVICLSVILSNCLAVWAQAGFNDDRVMLQGFYWESYRHGYPDKFPQFGNKKWYDIVKDQAGKTREGRFDMIWLPPPSYAGKFSAGYNPKEYFNLNNSYGTFAQHQAMVQALLQNGIEPIADIVINHRDGSTKWADFKNPDWGTWAITRDDMAFTNPSSEVYNTPVEKRGAPKEYPEHALPSTYSYRSFRNLDHTNPRVRRDIMRYLLQLKSLGYRGWRYDLVHGYHARWVAQYNRASQPTFSVGEYDWNKQGEQRGWVWYTATSPGDLRTASSVFDFMTFFTLKDNKGNYKTWYGSGHGLGLVGDTTENLPWKNRADRAVTFLENHDTGYRTNEDGTPNNYGSDSFANNWEVEQAYAFIITHPGVPCVFWKHFFDWGADLQNKIRALINARKVAGVNAGSEIYLQENARVKGIYAAMVQGKRGQLYVCIGGDDSVWQPSFSNYHDYREYAQGAGWKVWLALPGNPEVQQAPLKAALPVPQYRDPKKIEIPEAWLH
jgi:alpha-amylase